MTMDLALIRALRAWATGAAEGMAERADLAREADQYQASEVADLAASQFAALGERLDALLAGERARLQEALADAERAAELAAETFGAADHAAARLWEWEHSALPPTPDQRERIVSRRRETEEAAESAHEALLAAKAALEAFDAEGGEG